MIGHDGTEPSLPSSPDTAKISGPGCDKSTIGRALQVAVDEFPEHDFIVSPKGTISYREAFERSGSLARRMLETGIGKGTRVGLLDTYSVEWVIVWLAASRVGAIVIPMSTLYTPRELFATLRRADVQVLYMATQILDRDMRPFLEEAVPSLQSNDELIVAPELPYLRSVRTFGPAGRKWGTDARIGHGPIDLRFDRHLLSSAEREVCPSDEALVIYTSGSTGEPKGVVHTHRSLMCSCMGLVARLGSNAQQPVSVLCAFPFFWVGGILALLASLRSALRLVVIDRFDAAAALESAERHRVNDVLAWPTLIARMRSHETFAERDVSMCVALTKGSGDFALDQSSVPGVPRHRGMSETLGSFVAVDTRILSQLESASDDGDEFGELLVRGPGLMSGYYKRDRSTVFDSEGWYHTGDRVRMVDGVPYFLGRYTEMIKTRGANVSPTEVESVLADHPSVETAFVFGRSIEDGDEEVVAGIVWDTRGERAFELLLPYARKHLSAFKVPTSFVELSSRDLPSLANGKPDRLAIRAIVTQTAIAAHDIRDRAAGDPN